MYYIKLYLILIIHQIINLITKLICFRYYNILKYIFSNYEMLVGTYASLYVNNNNRINLLLTLKKSVTFL